MSDALDRARRDMERMQAEYDATQAALAALQRRMEDVATFIRMAEFYADEDAELAGKPRGGTSGAAVRLVIDHLRKTGMAVHTRPLLEMLKEQGIVIGGANPVANLSGFLSRSDELMNSRSHGWALAEWGSAVGKPPPRPLAEWAAPVAARPGYSIMDDQLSSQPPRRAAGAPPPPPEPEPLEWEPPEPESPEWEPPEEDDPRPHPGLSASLDDDIPF